MVLRLALNMVGDDNTNFSHKLLLYNRQITNPRKVFAKKSSVDIKLSKTQLFKMVQSGRLTSSSFTKNKITLSEIIENEVKEQKSRFLRILLGTPGANFLGNILARKEINRAGERIVRAGYGNKKSQKTTTKRQDHKNKWNF